MGVFLRLDKKTTVLYNVYTITYFHAWNGCDGYSSINTKDFYPSNDVTYLDLSEYMKYLERLSKFMKKYVLFVVFLCLVFLFGCDKEIQTEIVSENITEIEFENATEGETELQPESKTEYVYEPLTYKLVEPTQEELEEICDKLGRISVASTKNYNFETDNTYQYIFYWNELEHFYVPRYDEEIAKYIAEPVCVNEYGKGYWNNTY